MDCVVFVLVLGFYFGNTAIDYFKSENKNLKLFIFKYVQNFKVSNFHTSNVSNFQRFKRSSVQTLQLLIEGAQWISISTFFCCFCVCWCVFFCWCVFWTGTCHDASQSVVAQITRPISQSHTVLLRCEGWELQVHRTIPCLSFWNWSAPAQRLRRQWALHWIGM